MRIYAIFYITLFLSFIAMFFSYRQVCCGTHESMNEHKEQVF